MKKQDITLTEQIMQLPIHPDSPEIKTLAGWPELVGWYLMVDPHDFSETPQGTLKRFAAYKHFL